MKIWASMRTSKITLVAILDYFTIFHGNKSWCQWVMTTVLALFQITMGVLMYVHYIFSQQMTCWYIYGGLKCHNPGDICWRFNASRCLVLKSVVFPLMCKPLQNIQEKTALKIELSLQTWLVEYWGPYLCPLNVWRNLKGKRMSKVGLILFCIIQSTQDPSLRSLIFLVVTYHTSKTHFRA